MKYQNGRNVSPLVYQALRYVTKVGVISRTTWNELFSTGSLRWKQKQLRSLVNSGVFRHHPCDSIIDTYVMGRSGIEMAKDEKWKPVYFIQPQFIKHDETVARGLWILEKLKLCKGWVTERELKTNKSHSFKLNVREQGGKYPDGVFKLMGKFSSMIVALEYERSGKTNWRYNKTIKAYSESGEFNLIIYVVESSAIEESIKRGMRFIGDMNLNSKLGFVNAEEWKNNPARAQIRGLSLGNSLLSLVENI